MSTVREFRRNFLKFRGFDLKVRFHVLFFDCSKLTAGLGLALGAGLILIELNSILVAVLHVCVEKVQARFGVCVGSDMLELPRSQRICVVAVFFLNSSIV